MRCALVALTARLIFACGKYVCEMTSSSTNNVADVPWFRQCVAGAFA